MLVLFIKVAVHISVTLSNENVILITFLILHKMNEKPKTKK